MPNLCSHTTEPKVVVVAVPPVAQIDLRHCVESHFRLGVDQQPELDAVAGRERQSLEQ